MTLTELNNCICWSWKPFWKKSRVCAFYTFPLIVLCAFYTFPLIVLSRAVNTTIYVSSNQTLTCHSINDVYKEWIHYANNNSVELTNTSDGKIVITDNFELRIGNVNYEDQGFYLCQLYHFATPINLTNKLSIIGKWSVLVQTWALSSKGSCNELNSIIRWHCFLSPLFPLFCVHSSITRCLSVSLDVSYRLELDVYKSVTMFTYDYPVCSHASTANACQQVHSWLPMAMTPYLRHLPAVATAVALEGLCSMFALPSSLYYTLTPSLPLETSNDAIFTFCWLVSLLLDMVI